MPRVPKPDEQYGELSPAERDRLIEEFAGKIVSRGLETPAILFLEMHKPVSFLASQSALVVSPFLAPLFGREGIERYSALFNDRENVERLIRRIEDMSLEKDAAKAKKK